MYLLAQRFLGARCAVLVCAAWYALLIALVFWYWAPPDRAFHYLGM